MASRSRAMDNARGARSHSAERSRTLATERERTETGRTRSATWIGANGKTVQVESVRTKTDEGFARPTTATNAQGEIATRDVTVARDKDAGRITRDANATTFDGRTASTSDVKQRTDDGFTRDTTHTRTDGSTHTRAVDITCDEDTGKCDKQVKVDQSP
jgi:hypothetical protein